MPHHFTKGTVQASIWCNRCNKETPWRIADGRRQYCLTCYAMNRHTTETRKPTADAQQSELF